MAIKAHLQSLSGQRSSPRRSLRLDTSGRLPGGPAGNVTVHNISAAGLLLESAGELATGEELTINLPEAGAVDAVIVWRSENLYGCAFSQTLGSAALAAVQLRAAGAVTNPAGAVASNPVQWASGDGLGARINRLRRERRLTLADVAAALGVSKPTVWAWEKGKARPLPERIEAIAAALGVSPEELGDIAHASSEVSGVITECRARIAQACGTHPEAVKIMIDL
jgi:transcriptional regulator with XRE-family HTH domain